MNHESHPLYLPNVLWKDTTIYIRMSEDWPTEEHLDLYEERMLRIYDYDRLKDCDLYHLEAQLQILERSEFYSNSQLPTEGGLQGATSGYLTNSLLSEMDSMSRNKKQRIRYINSYASSEIQRAIGHQKQLKREHRNKLANSLSDLVSSLFSILPV